MKMLGEYLEHAINFERMAELGLKARK